MRNETKNLESTFSLTDFHTREWKQLRDKIDRDILALTDLTPEMIDRKQEKTAVGIMAKLRYKSYPTFIDILGDKFREAFYKCPTS